MKVRRVVTGHTPDGKSTVVSDSEVDAITVSSLPGAEFLGVWGADEAPIFPDDGSPRPASTYFPPGQKRGRNSLRASRSPPARL